MTKLLDKPFKLFSIYALIILISSIPVYFLVIDSIWIEELDEHNLIIHNQLESKLKKTKFEKDQLNDFFKNWNKIQQGIEIRPLSKGEFKKDIQFTKNSYNDYENEMNRFRVLCSTIIIQERPYQLIISTNVEEADETLIAITFVTIVFFILLFLGFLILNKRISKNSWKPFYQTLNYLKEFDLNKNKTIHFKKTDIDEFNQLNSTLSILIDKNTQAYNQQKRFVENASHELQTPLALLKTKIDLLFQNENLTAEQSISFEAINSNLSRITRINKNLLLLAKIENNQFSDIELVDLKEKLIENCSLLNDYIEDKKIEIQLNISPLIVECNATLLEVLVNNLIVNAIRHGKENKQIQLILQGNKLTISNTGNKSLNQKLLFVRFGITSNENTSSGLGLAIAKEICDKYNWKINYQFHDSSHQFSVEF